MLLYVNPVSASLRTADPAEFSGAKRRVALEELEHFFAYTLLREMRKSVPEGGLFPKTPAGSLHEEMLDDALSGAMAKNGQLGVARMVDEQLRIAESQGRWHAEIEARRSESRRIAGRDVTAAPVVKEQLTVADEGNGRLEGLGL
jgi:flagellar protein FlgJ